MAKHETVTIPASLVSELEGHFRGIAKVFGKIHASSGMKLEKVPKDQEWYWSKKWQQWEKEADEDIAAGRVKEFNSVEDLIAELNS